MKVVTHGHPLADLPWPCVWHGSLIPLLVQVGQCGVVDQLFRHISDLSERFAR